MTHRELVLGALLLGAAVLPASAQTSVRWSGLFYMDYQYVFSSPQAEEEGNNGFDYRRMYLTADYTLSDDFSGRARLEASGNPANVSPIVKDLYLKWKNAVADGHDLIFGVQSPPSYTLSEKFWGYRSLEKTIMDRQGIASSRDMGVSLNGRLTSDGRMSYDVMVGNNNSIRGEVDKYKRVYGQVAWQSDHVVASVGGDYAAGQDRHAINSNAFACYKTKQFRVGAEGYFQRLDVNDVSNSTDLQGISLWVVKTVNEKVEVVGRTDYVSNDDGTSSTHETFVIGGVAFSPNPKVHLIPNAYVVDSSGNHHAQVVGRVTIHADF